MRLPSSKLGARLACVGDDLPSAPLGESALNHIHEVGLLFKWEVLDGIEHFVKGRRLHSELLSRIYHSRSHHSNDSMSVSPLPTEPIGGIT